MQLHMAVDPKKSRITEQIDENLKRVYEDLLKVEVPDRFKELLDRLKQKDAGK